ncbi:MAG: SAM-dependent methyltransferase [Verrucomicrobiales bacterium]|nr:SAM-dependent methyltransferase [Verrucomicrobiales bacterium]
MLFTGLETWDPKPFRRVLERAGYTQAGLVGAGVDGVAYQGRSKARFLAMLPRGRAMSLLTRLFLLDEAVPAEEIMPLLGLETRTLMDLGLLYGESGGLRSAVQLTPVGDGWFAGDFLRRHAEAPEDYVMGLSPVTRLLASVTPMGMGGGGKALELGCGAGWLSLELRRKGRWTVTSTDLCGRALELGRFNEKLAGLSGIEWLRGSWFEPLGDRKFDLITCNPPYVQSPGGGLTYRETAAGEENPCAVLLRGAVEHLNPGGLCCVMLNWSHATLETWPELPLSWAPAEGMRRWLFQGQCQSPAEYAWRWIEHDPAFAEGGAAEELARWLAHYQKNGIRALSSGFMIVQRCGEIDGGSWTRTDSRAANELTTLAGAEILRMFANETWLRGGPGEAELLDRVFEVPDGIEAVMDTVLGGNGWGRKSIRVSSPGRLTYDGEVDENLLRLLELLRSGQPARVMVDELRARPEFAGVSGLESQIAGLVRELVRFALVALD